MHLCPFDSLFTKNVPHILEKIFLSLDYESFKNCLEVSKACKEQLTSELFQRKGKFVYKAELLLDEGKLIKASRDGRHNEVKRLFSSKMLDVNCEDGQWWSHSSPLHQAAYYGRSLVVQMLLDMGANLNITDTYGSTPLHCAVRGRKEIHKNVVKVLLDAGADPNKTKCGGDTPLHLVQRKDVAKLLLDGGAGG